MIAMRVDKSVVIYLDFKGEEKVVFKSLSQNPGIGGTQYVSVLLADGLKRLGWDITIASNQVVFFADNNFEFVNVKSYSDLFDISKEKKLIISGETHKKICPYTLSKYKKYLALNLVVWLHHPYYYYGVNRYTARSFVSCGFYAYLSNCALRSANSEYIRNIVVGSVRERARELSPDKNIKLFHMSNLSNYKGYIDFLKISDFLASAGLNIECHIVGSPFLYEPMSKKNTDFVSHQNSLIDLRFVSQEQIFYYGILGAEKYDVMSACDFAILNYAGRTEAFPASMLEAQSVGLPVLVKSNYGNTEFTTIVVRDYEDVLNIIRRSIDDVEYYSNLSKKSIASFINFESQNHVTMKRWESLLLDSGGLLSEAGYSSYPFIKGSYLVFFLSWVAVLRAFFLNFVKKG
ncbi:glycosyltransferase family 4 protein [Spongiibacter sp. KMU-158]|uniref:Glycosyltransferase family 4 protein n=1 Tax=Spongiibacter pelagi TaxID=2760804 RepID=A0A927GX36_9GAMM|nr:glycosyltransferase [Spongiibacter pelagi]MBD2860105.1 glycosyltransferase family 4 protein [Spongiibacter pelagi]